LLTLHPQFIKDGNGRNRMVVLPAKEFHTIMEELEEFVDSELFDEAKKEDNDERILFSDHLKNRKKKNA